MVVAGLTCTSTGVRPRRSSSPGSPGRPARTTGSESSRPACPAIWSAGTPSFGLPAGSVSHAFSSFRQHGRGGGCSNGVQGQPGVFRLSDTFTMASSGPLVNWCVGLDRDSWSGTWPTYADRHRPPRPAGNRGRSPSAAVLHQFLGPLDAGGRSGRFRRMLELAGCPTAGRRPCLAGREQERQHCHPSRGQRTTGASHPPRGDQPGQRPPRRSRTARGRRTRWGGRAAGSCFSSQTRHHRHERRARKQVADATMAETDRQC